MGPVSLVICAVLAICALLFIAMLLIGLVGCTRQRGML